MIAFITETQQEIISGAEYTPTFVGIEHSNDAAVMGLGDNLNDNCGETASPSVVVQNNGSDPITSLSIEYSINDGSSETYSWTGSIASLEFYINRITVNRLQS